MPTVKISELPVLSEVPAATDSLIVNDGTVTKSVTHANLVGNTLKAYSVKSYGAAGDGTTDDTTAIQAAITAAQNAGGGVVYFPEGVYLIRDTIFVTGDNISLVGDGQGASIITSDNSFVGVGESIPDTMIQVGNFPAADKIFHFAMRDLSVTATHITGLGNNTAVICLVHVNWAHFMKMDRVTFYGANNGTDGIGLLLTAMGTGGEQFAMLNSITDCEFTYNRDGIWWGVNSQGDINASQLARCRIGGTAVGTGTGVWVRANSYGNSFYDNDIEVFNYAFNLNGLANYLRGNLAEQNSKDFETADIGTQLHGNQINIVDSLDGSSFFQAHGMAKYLMLDSFAPNLIVDPQFNSKLYESAFIGTTITAKTTGDELGKNILTFTGDVSVGNKARMLVNNQDQPLRGWYTFVFRAKASTAGAGLYVRLPGTPDDFSFCELKSGTSLTLDLLEANAHQFVANEGRSSYLTTDYRTYFGSVYFDDQALTEGELRLSAQGSGITISVDYFGMFQGRNAHLPADDRVYERHTDVSALTSGGSVTITQLPYPTQVYMRVTSILNGGTERGINQMNLGVANGSGTSRVYHYDLNSFGYDSTGSDVTDDHLLINNASGLLFFSRTASYSSVQDLQTKIEFF
jgi:hypothetical protein